MNYWIFKCNPNRYRIDERLRDTELATTWLITRYRDQIGPGDIAFIWRTGNDRGICAIMRVDSRPQEMAEVPQDESFWVDHRETKSQWRVLGNFIHRGFLLTRDRLQAVPGLEHLSVFHGWQQATNFAVTQAEGAILWKLATHESNPPF